MGKLYIPFLVAAGALSVLALAGVMLHGHQSLDTHPLDAWIGKPLPDFNLQNASAHSSADATISNTDLKGQKALIAVVKADCLECRKEGASIHELQEDFRARLRIVVVSVSGASETAEFQRATGLYQNVYFDGMQLASSMEISHVPFLLFVGDDGRIKYFVEGNRTLPEVHAALDQFSSGEQITIASTPHKSPFQIHFLF